jgi:hypothetical protein
MKTLSLLEWQLTPWFYKGFTGNGLQTYLEIDGKRTEVQVIDSEGNRISHVGWTEEQIQERDLWALQQI